MEASAAVAQFWAVQLQRSQSEPTAGIDGLAHQFVRPVARRENTGTHTRMRTRTCVRVSTGVLTSLGTNITEAVQRALECFERAMAVNANTPEVGWSRCIQFARIARRKESPLVTRAHSSSVASVRSSVT